MRDYSFTLKCENKNCLSSKKHSSKNTCTLINLFFISIVLSLHSAEAQQNTNYTEFVANALVEIDSANKFQNAQWTFIDEYIQDKKIIGLGEFNHGAHEIFTLRNSLLKYLHQKHGFQVILFEAGMGEMLIIDQRKSRLSPEKMVLGFFNIWQTQAFAELMQYAGDNKIDIAGFDVQRSSNLFKQYLLESMDSAGISPDMYASYEKKFQILNSRYSKEDSLTLVDDISDLKQDYLELEHEFWNVNSQETSKRLSMVQKVLKNRVAYLDYMAAFNGSKDWRAKFAARDSIMADNVSWLIEKIYPNEKVILVAHNYHLSKYNSVESTMGEFLSAKFNEDYFAIGSFGLTGSFRGNNGDIKDISEPEVKRPHIKHLLNSKNGFCYFLNINAPSLIDVPCITEEIDIEGSFINLHKGKSLTLKRQFDAILLIREVSPSLSLQ